MPESTLNTSLNQNLDRHLETYQETQAPSRQVARSKQDPKCISHVHQVSKSSPSHAYPHASPMESTLMYEATKNISQDHFHCLKFSPLNEVGLTSLAEKIKGCNIVNDTIQDFSQQARREEFENYQQS